MSDIGLTTRQSLVWECRLNGDSLDSSGGGRNATVANLQYASSNRGFQPRCGVFNGSSTECYSVSALGFDASNRTYVASFKLNSLPASGVAQAIIFTQVESGANRRFWRYYVYNNSGTYQLSGIGRGAVNYPFQTGVWYQLAVTSSSTNENKFYLNGELLYTNTADDTAAGTGTSTNVTSIGSSRYTSASKSDWLNGNAMQGLAFDRILSQSEIRSFWKSFNRHGSGNFTSDLFTGCVAYYDFRGDANDVLGGNDATTTVATNVSSDFLGMARGLSFNGSTEYVLVPDSAALDLTACTILVGFNPGNGGTGTVLRKGYEAANATNYQVTVGGSNTLYWRTVGAGGRAHISPNGTIANNAVSHVAISCAHGDSVPTVYVNGTSVSMILSDGSLGTYTMAGNAHAMGIGSNYNGGDKFTGSIYYLAIFNIKKSASDMLALSTLLSKRYVIPM